MAIITPICRNVQGVFERYRVVIKWGEYDLFRLNLSSSNGELAIR
jgi:hypothetical protein